MTSVGEALDINEGRGFAVVGGRAVVEGRRAEVEVESAKSATISMQ